MKRVISTLVCALLVVGAQATTTGFGIKGGLNYSSLGQAERIQIENKDLSLTALKDSFTGWHLGVVGEFVFPGFYFQPELLYLKNGRDMNLRIAPDTDQEQDLFYTQHFHHLSMPLILGIKVGPLKLGAGPVVSVLLHDRIQSTESIPLSHQLKTATIGFQAGAGIKLGGLLLDLRYEGSLSNFGDGIRIGDNTYQFDPRPRQLILSFGILLF